MTFSRIIVTGADGWLGLCLVERLVTETQLPESFLFGSEIVAFVQSRASETQFLDLGIKIHLGDIRDTDCISRLLSDAEDSLVFHLAGVIHPPPLSQKRLYEVNHQATASLARLSCKFKVKKFVAMSSNSPTGYSKDPSWVMDEDSPYAPYMGYGKSKMLMEQEIISLSNTSRYTNFSIIRSPWFYGPNQPTRQSNFFRMVRSGTFPVIGNGRNLRSMAYVDNIVDGLLLSSEFMSKNGEVFWIADASPYPMAEVVSTVKNLMQNDFGLTVAARQIQLPTLTSDAARLVDASLQSFGLYSQKFHVLSEMNQTIACTIKKAESQLGYQPKVALEEGMRRSIQWCLDRGIAV